MSGEDLPAGLPAVVIQHRDDAPGGLLIDVLAEKGFRPATVRIDLGEPLPEPAAGGLVITVGNNDPAGGDPETTAGEIAWLRKADRVGAAVLAIGSGAQALALALGGRVDRAPTPRHGWVWISSGAPGWIAAGPWLAWRDAVIRLPPGAALLARDPVGPQAFATGRHLGIQFHPEVTPEIIGDWVNAECAECLDAQGLLEATSREFAAASVVARRLLSTYVHSLTRSSV
jgi:GMP synthase-like glutamine amidotransferase